ncbi:unnamed protein product [Penicillium salamii]|uniref:Major facilitator superfamily (MFS) profile domain-containing protein n=1 Tax=Penicillium salamii TaxID=1612424 RepID=A0A9W4JVK3_9EURO|nr:unnamed protein product [Penicillium salamii]CAG8189751.1 unnamed protein product [Penicillium salamii]CAG8248374.1 unnamed protein product [Penicillium salamii]CAG8252469.1 unnamed protein product [Penicillium salamii]CAG8275432.1 unnamed protein product [Penicillium salamii]
MPDKNEDSHDDSFIVSWDGEKDAQDPFNWPTVKKFAFTITGCLIVFAVAFASSNFGPATPVIANQYGVSTEVANLSVALFVAGFAAGPLFFAPFSQIYGHAVTLLIGIIGCAIFQIPLGVAQNIETVLVSRALMGLTGSAVLAVGSGMLAEVWGTSTRAMAIGLSATSLNMGSIVGPIAGNFVLSRYGWRWIGWVTLLVCVAICLLSIFTVRESSRQKILERRAGALRRAMRDTRYHALSEKSGITFGALVQRYFKVPLQMISREPILIILTAYLTLVYGTLYLSYQMLPYAFQHRGWSGPMSSLPSISTLLGAFSAWLVSSAHNILYYQPKKGGAFSLVPETRLPPMILGGCILPVALIWFGWSMKTHWFAQVLSCYFLGLSLQLIFITGVIYIIDVYLANANSAISIHVSIRSLVSASFSIWGPLLYTSLGIEWTSTLLAGLAAVLLPSPIIFYYWGARIRSWSRFTTMTDPSILSASVMERAHV